MKRSGLLMIGLVCLSAPAFADVHVDISGTQSWELFGDPLNEHIQIDLSSADGGSAGDDYDLTGVSWDVIMTSYAPSWADEPRIAIRDMSSAALIGTIGPLGSATTVTSARFTGSMGLPVTVSGGVIDLEFYETGFNDFTGAPDAIYQSPSHLWFAGEVSATVVPEPASIGIILAGLGILGFKRRRRS